jgi:tripartite-type tricarboxylate transporter receptor subunit TctC
MRLVIPFAPGGIFDYVARIASPKLTETLGQTVVVDNRSGGGGMIAMSTVAKSAPDGYTLLLADPSFVINPSLQAKAPYELDEFTPVTVFTTAALVLSVHSKVPAKNVQELVNLAAAGKLSYGSAGPGTTPHIAGELFKIRTKTNILHVPFKGVGPAVSAVVAEQVDLVFGSVAGTQGFFKDGRLRALGTTGAKRASALPNVPTIAESGYPGYEVSVWATVFVPKGTPAAIVSRINAEFNNALKDSGVRAALDKAAIEPVGTTPKEASAFVQREFTKYADVIRRSDIKPE